MPAPVPRPAPRPARRTQAERREQTQRALFTAAVECLAEQGYAATTLTEVVRRAGVSQGALWRYCKTKAELARAAVAWAAEQDRATWEPEQRDAGPAGPEVLLRRLLARPSTVLERASLELLRAAATDEDLRAELAASSWSGWLDFAAALRTALHLDALDERSASTLRVLALAGTALQVFYQDEDIATVLHQDLELLARDVLTALLPTGAQET